MQNLPIRLTMAGIVLAAASCASLAQTPPPPETQIQKQDADGDGRISAAEFKGGAEKFGRLDTDGDGFVTLAELEDAQGGPPDSKADGSGGPQPPEVTIQKQDADGDGRISAAEFKGGAEKFGRIDNNGDGFITLAELEAAQDGPPDDGSGKQGQAGGPKSCSANRDACWARQCSGQHPNMKAACQSDCGAREQKCLQTGQWCMPNGKCIAATRH